MAVRALDVARAMARVIEASLREARSRQVHRRDRPLCRSARPPCRLLTRDLVTHDANALLEQVFGNLIRLGSRPGERLSTLVLADHPAGEPRQASSDVAEIHDIDRNIIERDACI